MKQTITQEMKNCTHPNPSVYPLGENHPDGKWICVNCGRCFKN